MEIRPYTENDKDSVIDLFRANTPDFFDLSEEKDLRDYLETEVADYFVVEENDELIGAGGINYFLQERTARISWDIVKPNSQGKGIGKKLTEHRINYLKNNNKVDLIVVRTSQHVFKFYEKMGFRLIKVEKDFWAKGFDLYLMELNNITNN